MRYEPENVVVITPISQIDCFKLSLAKGNSAGGGFSHLVKDRGGRIRK